MEKKRFQIFVSSTFEDLKDERKAVFETVMKLGYIPAGMEDFPAFDEDQLDYIKSVIDDSDYYVLIIAGRYGSISEDGLSFTEKEYDYAVSKKIAVLSFIYDQIDDIAVGKTDRDAEKMARLTEFKNKVKRAGRNVKFWHDAPGLALQVTQSLNHAIRTKPASGWIRGNAAASVEILSEINDLRKTNENLREEIKKLKEKQEKKIKNIAPMDGKTEIRIKSRNFGSESFTQKSYPFSWADIFKIIGPSLMAPQREDIISSSIITFLTDSRSMNPSPIDRIIKDDIAKIKIQFIAHGFIESIAFGRDEKNIGIERLKITELGEKQLIELRAIRGSNVD